LFTVRNLNNGSLGAKSVYANLVVLAGVPCPLKINLQCSAGKKVRGKFFRRIQIIISYEAVVCCKQTQSRTCRRVLTTTVQVHALGDQPDDKGSNVDWNSSWAKPGCVCPVTL